MELERGCFSSVRRVWLTTNKQVNNPNKRKTGRSAQLTFNHTLDTTMSEEQENVVSLSNLLIRPQNSC